MNWNISRRLKTAEENVSVNRGAADIPRALDLISAEDRELLKPYLDARKQGTGATTDWPKEVHRAMHRYLRACVEHDKLLAQTGLPVASLVAETLRRRDREAA
jgi:hypothetical protein